MPMSPSRWNDITTSQFTWERNALAYIRQRLPEIAHYRAWTNFEFIASDGSINEVDALIITRVGFFLVEIKSRPGHLKGDAGTWMWRTSQGKVITEDNSLLLANRKAKKLISLIQTQKAMQKVRRPFLEALVFCSAQDLTWDLKGHGDMHVCFRRKKGARPASNRMSRPSIHLRPGCRPRPERHRHPPLPKNAPRGGLPSGQAALSIPPKTPIRILRPLTPRLKTFKNGCAFTTPQEPFRTATAA